MALLEKTDEEVEQEIAAELDANPALERRDSPEPPAGRLRRVSASDFDPSAMPQADAGPTLREFLLAQLAENQEITPLQRRLAAYMVDAVDSNGYLTRTLPQLATDLALTLDAAPAEADVRAAFAALRGLDPAGVGAQDLRDCLVLQLRRLDPRRRDVDDALEITRYFFDIYSSRNMKRLAAESHIPAERVRAADELITSLNPKPGAPFAADPTQALGEAAVSPDFFVETDGETLTVTLANSLPELQIEASFSEGEEADGEAGAFIREQRQRAESFIDLLQRRARTMLAIARAIVRIQAPFFLGGDDESKIRPMVLRQVAEATGMDLTMVSRAVAGKWLATPWGVYSLKSFFNHRSGADDDETSAREIGAAMREIIAAESPSAPLSDEAIAAELARRGYRVARRTVAKYRGNLHIPPARLRRKE